MTASPHSGVDGLWLCEQGPGNRRRASKPKSVSHFAASSLARRPGFEPICLKRPFLQGVAFRTLAKE